MARALLAAMLLACNAPSKDGLYSRSGAGGALGSSGSSGSSSGGSGNSGTGGASGGSGAQGLGGTDAAGGGGAGGSGNVLDGGTDAVDAAPPAEPDAAAVCSGTLVDELCWHLGDIGDSCTDTCASRGGYDVRGTPIIGSDEQGGSLQQCTIILEALLGEEADTNDDNDSGSIGCHLRGDDEDRVWLEESDFSPDASDSEARIACSCNG